MATIRYIVTFIAINSAIKDIGQTELWFDCHEEVLCNAYLNISSICDNA